MTLINVQASITDIYVALPLNCTSDLWYCIWRLRRRDLDHISQTFQEILHALGRGSKGFADFDESPMGDCDENPFEAVGCDAIH